MIFNLPPICGLFPLLLYIVLAFKKGMHPLVNVSICAVVGAIMVKQPLNGLGAVIYESMGSFLALVGFIIMLGSGLGMVLRKTGVAAAIVNGADAEDRRPYPEAGYDRHHGLFRGAGHPAGHFGRCQRRDRPHRDPAGSCGGHHSLRAGRHLPGAPVRPDCSSAPSPRLW